MQEDEKDCDTCGKTMPNFNKWCDSECGCDYIGNCDDCEGL